MLKTPGPQLQRRLGMLNATSINMSNMAGIGPFITIPLTLAALMRLRTYLVWLVGTIIALADRAAVNPARVIHRFSKLGTLKEAAVA